MAALRADRRLCLDLSLSRLVEENTPEAAFLLAGTGQEIPADAVKRLDLRVRGGRVVQGPEAVTEAVAEPEADSGPVAPLADIVHPAGAMAEPARPPVTPYEKAKAPRKTWGKK